MTYVLLEEEMTDALLLWQKKRDCNKEYHKRRWASDPEYRERKRALSRRRAAAPDFNQKRREARRSNPKIRQREAEYAKKWAAARMEALRSYRLRRSYGLTPQDVERMLSEQGGCC